jgi:hypothetical protein
LRELIRLIDTHLFGVQLILSRIMFVLISVEGVWSSARESEAKQQLVQPLNHWSQTGARTGLALKKLPIRTFP